MYWYLHGKLQYSYDSHNYCFDKGRSYRRTFFVEISKYFFRAIFSISAVSDFFLPDIGMRSLPNILHSVNFPNFGNVSCFFLLFLFFSEKQRGKIGKKSCSTRTALTPSFMCKVVKLLISVTC